MSEVSGMRVARTYTVELDLVQELKKHHLNASETVNRSVRTYFSNLKKIEETISKNETLLQDATIRQLLAVLQTKYDQFDAQYSLIQTLIALNAE